MNKNKGFVMSTYVYIILVFFLLVLVTLLLVLNNTKMISRKVKEQVTKTIKQQYTAKFGYTGSVQTFVAPYDGKYRLEVWGAQGGNSSYGISSSLGGYGGYSTGAVELDAGDVLYVYVGGQGQSVKANETTAEFDENTGFNGGGYAGYYPSNSAHGGGGGATHIATVSAPLPELFDNQDTILIIAGGGGGSSTHKTYPNYSGRGGSGGGFVGGRGVPSNTTCYNYGTGGSQLAVGTYVACETGGHNDRGEVNTNNPAFGLGAVYTSEMNEDGVVYSGGGAGYYGGESGYHAPGGGGSGYIGSSLLFDVDGYIKKHMAGYDVETATEEIRLTNSVTSVSLIPERDQAKIGNGFAVITYLD